MISTLAVAFAALFAQQSACDSLKTLSVPNTKITSVEFVPAGPYVAQGRGGRGQTGPQLPAHCRIAAVLTPSTDSHIEMELWLPSENWNGKFLAVGNGGWAGNIETGAMATALSRGYATASNDTGHKGGSASFAVGHPEKLIDFGYRSMHEMTVQSKAIIKTFYSRAPQLSYYQGCSTGGRQGMMEAQRYPEDFDAIIAGAPVYNQVHLNTSQVSLQVNMLKDPSHIVPQAKVALFAKSVMAACDGKDGVKDGIVSDPQSCKFDPASLICKEGDGPDCLTAAQADSAKKAYAPVKTANGEFVYPGHSPGFESGWRIPMPGAALNPLFGDMPRYISREDANWDLMSFDLDKDLALALKNGGFIEANDPDLSKFKARGGKLIFYHGWADPGPAPENTINYYSQVVAKTGKADDWMRLFLLPGVGHCGGGVGPDRADFLTALEQWKEKGVAPGEIVASRIKGGQVDMTRPLCPYPQLAKWNGSGNTNEAGSFICAAK